MDDDQPAAAAESQRAHPECATATTSIPRDREREGEGGGVRTTTLYGVEARAMHAGGCGELVADPFVHAGQPR